ncbi:MAG TPA: hypothetical protein VIV60_02200, partial [Polyangiaceae bacterium]
MRSYLLAMLTLVACQGADKADTSNSGGGASGAPNSNAVTQAGAINALGGSTSESENHDGGVANASTTLATGGAQSTPATATGGTRTTTAAPAGGALATTAAGATGGAPASGTASSSVGTNALGQYPIDASPKTRGGTMTFTNIGAAGWWPRRLERPAGDPA